MESAMRPARMDARDRLGLTLFLAAALHAIVILGVAFDFALRAPDEPLPTMEVILVHSHTEETPEKADYLAQASQEGGGQVEEAVRPSSPLPQQRPVEESQGKAPRQQPAAAPEPERKAPEQPPAAAEPEPTPQRKPTMQAQVASEEKVAPEPEPAPAPRPEDRVKASQLLQSGREIARLSAEIRQRQEAYAKRPRHKYITANTREHVTAAYEEAWRLKVERVGNLNYPDEARRRELSGSLILDVAIAADGSLHDLRVLRSSGHPALDEGAQRIVRLAAPFAELPDNIREQTDILHIVRTWRFRSGRRLQTFGR